jgi:acyl-CoA dehydrogenase
MVMEVETPSEPAELRAGIRSWFEAEAEQLAPFRTKHGSFEDEVAHEEAFMALLCRAGWSRWGWPTSCGGLGGTAVLRAVVYEEVFAAGFVLPEAFELLETLGPVLVHYAPHLAQRHLPPYLLGQDRWGQGFSEPDAGSDLASLRTRATQDGDRFVLNGQKTWTSMGHLSSYGAVLVRTGPPDSAHRGLSMLWVDLASPGVTVRPIRAANGRNEFAEMFFDDVSVPADHLIGELHGGWGVAMYLLQFERGMYAWERQAMLHTRLRQALEEAVSPPPQAAAAVGAAYVILSALRAKSRETVIRLAAEENPGPDISVDKILLSTAEQVTHDAIRMLLWPAVEIDDDDASGVRRDEWMYTRASSIFGGAVEVQRDIVAERVLGMPKGRSGGR